MGKLLPVILLVIGVGIGGGAGAYLKPKVEACDHEPCGDKDASHAEVVQSVEDEPNYLAMKGQFVVPVIQDELVRSLIVMTLSLEVEPGATEEVYSKEPKLRDAFLRVLFDHAHVGGFNGAFTESGRLSILRVALLETAQLILGAQVQDILITDIIRQEM